MDEIAKMRGRLSQGDIVYDSIDRIIDVVRFLDRNRKLFDSLPVCNPSFMNNFSNACRAALGFVSVGVCPSENPGSSFRFSVHACAFFGPCRQGICRFVWPAP
jgi:hypothetical protein